jgi:hypothetical protein
MPQPTPIRKSLLDKVLDELLAELGGQPEFDAQTIRKLKALAERGDLNKAKAVKQAIE